MNKTSKTLQNIRYSLKLTPEKKIAFQNQSVERCFVTALPCEARPLIHHFALKRIHRISAFPVYRNESLSITLVVSGVGIANAAAATALIAGQYGKTAPLFINLGIAGAFDIPIGNLRLINKVSNTLGHSIYPMGLNYFQLEKAALITYPQPTQADKEALADMEGFGFYQAAMHFTTLECIHALKVISDNPYQNPSQIHPKLVQAWITDHLPTIEQFLERLTCFITKDVTEIHPTFSEQTSLFMKKIHEQFHLTQYRQYQIKKMITKMLAFGLESKLVELEKEKLSLKEWMNAVSNQITQYSLNI